MFFFFPTVLKKENKSNTTELVDATVIDLLLEFQDVLIKSPEDLFLNSCSTDVHRDTF